MIIIITKLYSIFFKNLMINNLNIILFYICVGQLKILFMGGTDEGVTTFAIVSGAYSASLSIPIILILRFANLFADGFSMSIGNYISKKTHKEYIEKERKKEEWSIDNLTSEEKEEIREIYKNKDLKMIYMKI
jgi:VIT1/CCC1 family predicted Fe2+/Mn2+ transporter